MDLLPSILPLPDPVWFAANTGDALAGLAVFLLGMLFSVLFRSLPERNIEVPTHVGSDGFEAVRRRCLTTVRETDLNDPEYAHAAWNAVRECLERGGLLPWIRTMAAEEFLSGTYERKELADAAVLARYLSYGPKSERLAERNARMRELSENFLTSLR